MHTLSLFFLTHLLLLYIFFNTHTHCVLHGFYRSLTQLGNAWWNHHRPDQHHRYELQKIIILFLIRSSYASSIMLYLYLISSCLFMLPLYVAYSCCLIIRTLFILLLPANNHTQKILSLVMYRYCDKPGAWPASKTPCSPEHEHEQQRSNVRRAQFEWAAQRTAQRAANNNGNNHHKNWFNSIRIDWFNCVFDYYYYYYFCPPVND